MTTAEYRMGWKARCEGFSFRSCPFNKATNPDGRRRWYAGWYAANSDPVRLSEDSF